MQISYHSTLTKIQKLRTTKKKKKKKHFSVSAGTPSTGWYCPKLAGIFSGMKQGGYMYRFACRYSIFRRYQPVWYGIDSLELKTFQAYFNEMGVQYGDDFEDFLKLAMLLFLGLDFSQIQINNSVMMSLTRSRRTLKRQKLSGQRARELMDQEKRRLTSNQTS